MEGGALFAVLAGGYKFYADWREDRSSLSVEACRRADAAILDDRLNSALSDSERKAYLNRKLRISERCDRLQE